MLQKLKDLIFKSQGLDDVTTPSDKKMAFMVILNNKHVGTLELEEGKWYFSYSDFFKQDFYKSKSGEQKEHSLAPLFGFPDIEKAYESEILWPFFAGRIPGLKQPEVKEIIEREHIDKNDLAALLARFGKKTISNPFELTVAS
ncbi:MAG: HipA N-terminal domain-containing protein [Saprospiraceae bacterium]